MSPKKAKKKQVTTIQLNDNVYEISKYSGNMSRKQNQNLYSFRGLIANPDTVNMSDSYTEAMFILTTETKTVTMQLSMNGFIFDIKEEENEIWIDFQAVYENLERTAIF